MKMNVHRPMIILLAATVVAGMVAGQGCSKRGSSHTGHEHGDTPAAAEQIWTCSMHPEIRLSQKGTCPKCGMSLIPLVEVKEEEPTGVQVDQTDFMNFTGSPERLPAREELT